MESGGSRGSGSHGRADTASHCQRGWNLEERDPEAPWAPDLLHTLDVLDGCAAQFAGKNNYHQDAVWKAKTGVARNHLTHEAGDGKGPS